MADTKNSEMTLATARKEVELILQAAAFGQQMSTRIYQNEDQGTYGGIATWAGNGEKIDYKESELSGLIKKYGATNFVFYLQVYQKVQYQLKPDQIGFIFFGWFFWNGLLVDFEHGVKEAGQPNLKKAWPSLEKAYSKALEMLFNRFEHIRFYQMMFKYADRGFDRLQVEFSPKGEIGAHRHPKILTAGNRE